ncbi:hypothetical protein Z950_472 [Sulfitobacter mediterraneus KCTC 32188]|nr:hypothetical protein Z950_472 [Sulfitobacter mediterraneus KCTC 32188]
MAPENSILPVQPALTSLLDKAGIGIGASFDQIADNLGNCESRP